MLTFDPTLRARTPGLLRHADTLMVCRDGSDDRVADGLDERMAHVKAVATDV